MQLAPTVDEGYDGSGALGPKGPLLDVSTLLSNRLAAVPDGWAVKVYPSAGEAVLFIPPAARMTPEGWEVDHGLGHQERFAGVVPTQSTPELDEAEADDRAARNLANAASRARARSRRYCKANKLTRLVTLTYATKGYDPHEVAQDIRGFFLRLRKGFGGEHFPYVWVRELHKDGSLHVHIGLGRRVAMRCRHCDDGSGKGLSVEDIGGPCLRCTWAHGFVDARMLRRKDGSKAATKGRAAAGQVATYLAKYVGKAFAEGEAGSKRYEVGRGFQPHCVTASAGELPGTAHEVQTLIAQGFFDGAAPSFVWSSLDVEDWPGPPVRVCFW